MDMDKEVYEAHLGGKIEVTLKRPVRNKEELAVVYTPGVAQVCNQIHEKPNMDHFLTIKRNSVAVITDGTAVLGLGDIGPAAAMPVMEGKAMLFKQLANVDAYPIAIDPEGKSVDEIVECIRMISTGFGGINLEDISAPRCFEIEEKLQHAIDIPVFHDDQHGTAVVVLAALLNAIKLLDKNLEDLKVVVSGVGAAGVACSKILLDAGVRNIIGCDRAGAIYEGRHGNMNASKENYARCTNPNHEKGSLSQVLKGADLFLGLSGPNLIGEDELRNMNKNSMVFAMSNPTPEVPYELAIKHCKIVATGRSDYPNQINNVLCFPGFFRGLLDAYAYTVTENMKQSAASAIASCVSDRELNENHIIPDAFNPDVAKVVAKAVAEAAALDKVCKEVHDPELGKSLNSKRGLAIC
jgi:malate dehydrogenase (oxaloacetate-decarboxylating)